MTDSCHTGITESLLVSLSSPSLCLNYLRDFGKPVKTPSRGAVEPLASLPSPHAVVIDHDHLQQTMLK